MPGRVTGTGKQPLNNKGRYKRIFFHSRLIAGIRAKMKNETTYIQTHTMAYKILNHAHTFCMAKQLTTEILLIRTSLPFVYNI